MGSKSEPIRKVLSNNIKKYRGIFRYTQEILAEVTGLSTQTINDIEGCRRWISPKTLSKLAEAFNIEEYQLLLPENDNPGKKTNLLTPQSLIALQIRVKKSIDSHFEEVINTDELVPKLG